MRKNFTLSMLILMTLLCTGYPVAAQDMYDITVAADGSGDFTSIQEAVNNCKAFPDKRITIFIKNGIYREKIVVPSCNPLITMRGESAENTIITFDDHFNKINRGRNSTFYTYTLLVIADDFHAENLTIENSAGPVGQAIALFVHGDRCIFRNCRIMGNQDTLFTDGFDSRHFFESCYIEGTTDFIFGPSTAIFTECIIHSKKNSYITAASTPEGKKFGYVFINCRLTASEGVKEVYLGRPWRDNAKTAFIYCEMGDHILPEGWSNWSGTSRDKTAFYAEYENTGPGADTRGRVPWSHNLTRKQAKSYTPENIFSLPATDTSETEWWTDMK